MKEKRMITWEKFKRVARHSWSEYMKIDLTDYFQWEGFSRFLDFMWENFDNEEAWEEDKFDAQTAKNNRDKALAKAEKEGMKLGREAGHSCYTRIIGQLYWRRREHNKD